MSKYLRLPFQICTKPKENEIYLKNFGKKVEIEKPWLLGKGVMTSTQAFSGSPLSSGVYRR